MAGKKKETKETKKEFEVTQEYLDANPELIEKGIAVGDTIEVDGVDSAPDETPAEKPKASKGAMAVLKNGTEYLRTYGADQKEELAEFLSKSASYSAVPDASIEALDVPYEIKDITTGVITRTAKRFVDKDQAIQFRNEHRSNCVVVSIKK